MSSEWRTSMGDNDQWQRELAAEGAVYGQSNAIEGLLHFGRAGDEYTALVANVGIADLGDWTRIKLFGTDRASFLHNMCTNEVRKLPAGAGCEAFFLNAKGHALGHGFVFSGTKSHLLFGAPGQTEKLLSHLDRYMIREDVQLHDDRSSVAQFLVAGPQAPDLFKRWSGVDSPGDALVCFDLEGDGIPTFVYGVALAGPANLLLSCPREYRLALWKSVIDCGARPCGLQALEMARLEFGFPLYGRDIGEQNLPQEVNRDQRAISFVKGCYIGQETVARIDALGHVNRTLVGLKIQGETLPEPGTALAANDQNVGEITSAAFSPRLRAVLALAYMRRGHESIGTAMNSTVGSAEVVPLPL